MRACIHTSILKFKTFLNLDHSLSLKNDLSLQARPHENHCNSRLKINKTKEKTKEKGIEIHHKAAVKWECHKKSALEHYVCYFQKTSRQLSSAICQCIFALN